MPKRTELDQAVVQLVYDIMGPNVMSVGKTRGLDAIEVVILDGSLSGEIPLDCRGYQVFLFRAVGDRKLAIVRDEEGEAVGEEG